MLIIPPIILLMLIITIIIIILMLIITLIIIIIILVRPNHQLMMILMIQIMLHWGSAANVQGHYHRVQSTTVLVLKQISLAISGVKQDHVNTNNNYKL
jgi:uncharacterized membrane protein YqjE